MLASFLMAYSERAGIFVLLKHGKPPSDINSNVIAFRLAVCKLMEEVLPVLCEVKVVQVRILSLLDLLYSLNNRKSRDGISFVEELRTVHLPSSPHTHTLMAMLVENHLNFIPLNNHKHFDMLMKSYHRSFNFQHLHFCRWLHLYSKSPCFCLV